MFNNFSEEYKQVMVAAEQTVQSLGYREILPEDIFREIVKLKDGNIYDILSSFWVNETIVTDVLSRPPFLHTDESRTWAYIWLSQRMKDLIVLSMKTAASFQKSHVSLEDFILALFRIQTENWFYQLLDFIGISPKDFEDQVSSVNMLIAKNHPSSGGMFAPIDDIMKWLEWEFIPWSQLPGMKNPFVWNRGQEGKKDPQTPTLDFFGTDLTLLAKQGKIDPIIGRDTEIDRLISILNRKTKNNPCLVWDPWVGKTAIVEWLARAISQGKVPMAMQRKRVISLSLSDMVAGTKYRWEFEWRLKMVIEEASKMENEIVLFIDEIHTIIGAGAGEGSLDAANILKPAMSRWQISLIGATTLSEYQKHIEKDSALERRFQKIDVDEPDTETAVAVITGLREGFEEFHNLIIDDDAIRDAVELSSRYITDRFLPDKAIDLIDEACSAKSMTYTYDEEDTTELKEKVASIQKEIEWFVMSGQYQKAIQTKKRLEDATLELEAKKKKRIIPRKNRMHITSQDIQKIVHQMTGVPRKNLESEDISKLRSLGETLKKRILWQDEAIESIVSSLKRSRVGISDTNRPIGSFLFLGPTGVGKTELVKVLAEEFFWDEKALIKLDMSEYQERFSSSKLLGATAWYVGYEEGGMLTEKVRRKPYSIVLFDEIEKGSPDVANLLLQILEDGVITDGKGRKVNFKNTIVIMTSNIGSEEFNATAWQIGFSVTENEEARIIRDYQSIREKVMKELDDYLAPELINRIDKVVVFNPLDTKILHSIVRLQLDELTERLEKVGIAFSYTTKAVNFIVKKTFNPTFWARPVRRYIQDAIEDIIANAILEKAAKKSVEVSADTKQLTFVYPKK